MTARPVSIRRRLLAALLSVVGGGWIVSSYLIYQDARHEVEEVFDASLAQTAHVLESLLAHEVDEDIEIRQAAERARAELADGGQPIGPALTALLELQAGVRETEPLRFPSHASGVEHRYRSTIALLGRGADGAVLVRTPNSPELARGTDGFSRVREGANEWRVFSLTDPRNGVLVQVAEHENVRQKLVREIAGNALTPLLFALPLLALLVWIGVSEGLRPLRRVADEVRQLAPDSLRPLEYDTAPTEAQPLIRALNGLLGRLDSALDQERRFTADAAHELRTPLAALQTQAQVALRAVDEVQRRRALERILDGVRRATRLVEQLLALARADAEPARGAPLNDVDLRALAGSVLEDLAPSAVARGVEIGLDGPPTHVRGDPYGLRVLLRNLVDNAVRYTEEGGRVDVTVGTLGDRAVLRVEDNGPGIPPEQRDAAFERFHRGEGVSASGTGLGLSIVKRIAEVHGAELELADGPEGRGLRVEVRFPA